jgi:ATP-dependent RNA helicase DHX8/PRP22
MASLPLDPIYSKALILASETEFNCLEEMLITVAMLSVESIFFAPREKLSEVFIYGLLPIWLLFTHTHTHT